MKKLLCFIAILFAPVSNAEVENPVILISIDGFAYHYLEKFKPINIMKLAEKGALVKGLIPVFPSKTFPNHVSMVTGVMPVKHGIVHNKFYHRKINQPYNLGAGKDNPEWLTATPIWTIAEQQNIKTGIYFWPESETKVDGVLPSYYFPYQHNTPNEQRFDQLIKWLQLPKTNRPQLLVTYFSTIDSAGHYNQQSSTKLKHAINDFDTIFGTFLKRIKTETEVTPNIILVSDHGMLPISAKHNIIISKLLSPFDQLNVINGQTQLYIYEDDKRRLNDVRSHLNTKNINGLYEVFTIGNYPEHWHFNKNIYNEGTGVIPDMVVNAIPPATFSKLGDHIGSNTHGYDAKFYPELNGIFIASGPNIRKNIQIKPVTNTEVFSVLFKLLKLNGQQIDNKPNMLKQNIIKID